MAGVAREALPRDALKEHKDGIPSIHRQTLDVAAQVELESKT
jgi:hypothetical protein